MRTMLFTLVLAVLGTAAPASLRAEDCGRKWVSCYAESAYGPGADWIFFHCDADYLDCLMKGIRTS